MVYKRVGVGLRGGAYLYEKFLSTLRVLRARKGKNFELKRTIASILSRKYLIASRKWVFINQMALFGDDLIRKYPAIQKFIQ